MIWKYTIVLSVFFLAFLAGRKELYGQSRYTDSLMECLNSPVHDTSIISVYFLLGDDYRKRNSDSAFMYYDKARILAEKKRNTLPRFNVQYAQALYKTGLYYRGAGKPDKAIGFYEKALTIFISAGEKKLAGKCYNSIGIINTTQGNYEEAIRYYKKSLEIDSLLGDKSGRGTTCSNIGTISYLQGNYQDAIGMFTKALNLFRGTADSVNIGNLYNNIANIYLLQGDYTRATEYYFRALVIAEKTKNNNGLINANMNLGNIHMEQKSHALALKYYKDALAYSEQSGDKTGICKSLTDIGLVNSSLGNYSNALACFKKVMLIYTEIGDKRGVSACYTNIGLVYRKIGDYRKAEENYMASLKIDEAGSDKLSLVKICTNLSGLYYLLRKYDRAVLFGEKAYAIAKEMGTVPDIQNAAGHLKRAYLGTGNKIKALVYAKQYMQLGDTLKNKDLIKAITEMEKRYEAEKKQLTIAKLEKEKEYQQTEISKQRFLLITCILGCFIILVFSIALGRLFMQKKKANLLLAFQNEEIFQKNEEIAAQRDEIEVRRDEIACQRDLVIVQKEQIEEINRELTGSIRYAEKIQHALFPDEGQLKEILDDHFILFKPRDIVSGDFYWVLRKEKKIIFCVADCTGHGVPGSLMSMMGIAMLNEIYGSDYVPDPAQALDMLRNNIIRALQQKGISGEHAAYASISSGNMKDGMDMALVIINSESLEMQFAGANNPCWIIQNEKANADLNNDSSTGKMTLQELKGDKMPVAIHEHMDPFSLKELKLNHGDIIILASDGFEDQFGGPNNKKYKAKQLKEVLEKHAHLTMEEISVALYDSINIWMSAEGNKYEQVDDISVLGIRV